MSGSGKTLQVGAVTLSNHHHPLLCLHLQHGWERSRQRWWTVTPGTTTESSPGLYCSIPDKVYDLSLLRTTVNMTFRTHSVRTCFSLDFEFAFQFIWIWESLFPCDWTLVLHIWIFGFGFQLFLFCDFLPHPDVFHLCPIILVYLVSVLCSLLWWFVCLCFLSSVWFFGPVFSVCYLSFFVLLITCISFLHVFLFIYQTHFPFYLPESVVCNLGPVDSKPQQIESDMIYMFCRCVGMSSLNLNSCL